MPSLTLPSEVSVMTLPETVFFPKVLLPIHIFEPRYRLMLQKALEGSRIFSVALANDQMEPHSIATLGIIRACVDNADGSSNLVLQGLTRVRLTGFSQNDPFPLAKIEVLHSDNPDDVEVDALVNKTLEYVHQYKENGVEMPEWMEDFLKNLSDRDTLVDMVSYGFVQSTSEKQKILETLSLKERFHRLVHILKKQSEV
jgi:Lon protease-like protein